MGRAVLAVVAFLVLLTTASACGTGARELDEWAYVFSIGVDKGVAAKYRYTFQFPTLTSTQGNGGNGTNSPKTEGSNDREEITIDCSTLQAGVNLVLSSYSRRMNFTHALYLIISEELARESVEPLINSMTRSAEIRRTMNVIIVRGKAMDFIREFNPVAGASVAKSQEKFIQNADISSLYENMRYNEFANRIKCTKCQATATMAALNDFSNFKEDGRQVPEFISEGEYYAGEIPRKSANKFDFLGTALFNGMKMVGELNGNETRSMLMLRGTFKESQITIPDPEDTSLRVSALVFEKRGPDVKIDFEAGKVKIHASVFLEGSLLSVHNTGSDEPERIVRLEEAFQRFIREKLDQTVKKCQELNCEVFDFGYKAARQFLTIQDWEKFDWLSAFKDAEVTTDVEFILRRTGTIIATEDEKKAEG